jgi:hypothetical protein
MGSLSKLGASLASVSTTFTPVQPNSYRFQIAEVTEHPGKAEDGKTPTMQYRIKNKVVKLASGEDTEEKNRTITDFINIHNKDGSLNQYGLINLKRYFEVILGEDVVAERGDDLDTDELKNGFFDGDVTIEYYDSKKEFEADGSPKKVPQNRIKAMAPVS